ncbi:MAG TPA: hypothetical protein VLM78_07585, partial [Anaerolineales bacterium]|nr:hypothetical protein [Anaerolineales bacterium]
MRIPVSPRNRDSGKRFIWYPFLFAAYPVLGLLAYNVGNARPEAGARPVAAAVLGAAALFGLLRLLTRDWHRAAFVSAVWISLFAAYGHVYIWLQEEAEAYARTNLVAGVSLLVAAAALFAATRPKVRYEAWTSPLNMVALALVVFPLGQIVWYQFDVQNAPSVAAESPVAAVEGTKPDIYYIILDSYTRADTLQTAYRFDNSEFLGGLEEMGFDVAECSMSNYVRTELSLASSFNMDFLPVLDKRIKPDSQARSPLWNLIRNSAVMDYVEGQGYETVAVATGFPWSEWDHADLYLEASPLRGGLTEFEGLLLGTTAYRIAEDEGLVDTKLATFNRYRERSQFVLDMLPSLAQMDGPQFVFAHIIVPHPPFVFAEDGSRSDSISFLNAKDQYPSDKYAAGYVMQLQFINREITRIVQEIIANSDTPPVIIIQGDHGPWLQPKERRLSILNAYYLPNHEDAVSESITPVNTFRVVFYLYLGG